MLVICFFILFIWVLLKSVIDFVNVWKSEVLFYWQNWGELEFVDLYCGMFGEFWFVIFGKVCEEVGSDLLVKK